MVAVGFGEQLDPEPLNEDSIEPVLFHPLEMAEHGGGVVVAQALALPVGVIGVLDR